MATKAYSDGKSDAKPRQTDAKARVTLPREFADSLVVVERIDEFEVRVRKVVAIPEREAWLWKNSKALGAVMFGLDQAKEGDLVEGPDVAADLAAFGDED